MKKFIRYLYEYQNGRRVLNAGFVKAEESGSSAVLQIYGKGFPTAGRSMEILLFYLMGDQVVGISMGTAENVRPMFGYRLTYTPEDVGGEEIFQAIEGVIILSCASGMEMERERGSERASLPAGQGCRWYAALWNDGTAAIEKMIRREEVLRQKENDARRESGPEENDAGKQNEREKNGDGVRNEQGENGGGIRKELEENGAGQEDALGENDERMRSEQGENGSGIRKELGENGAGKQNTREKNDDGMRSKTVENGGKIRKELEKSNGAMGNSPEENSREIQNASEENGVRMRGISGGSSANREEAPIRNSGENRNMTKETEVRGEVRSVREENNNEPVEPLGEKENAPEVESEGQEEGTVQAKAEEDTRGEREIYKITRRDLAKLPRREWKLANNHFLMHGYRNYHYLVSFKKDGYCWLGVPGIYHPREQQAASAFGFGQFMRPDGQENISGEGGKSTGEEFGYWCRAVGALIQN
ncbi:hypothetical protein ABXS75_04630 [Roseburia hominis]